MAHSHPSGTRPSAAGRRFVVLQFVLAMPLVLVAALPAALADPPPPTPQQYTMTDLGTLRDGLESHATFINKRGQVAGESYTATGARHAFFWDGATMHDLGPFATLVGLNDQGQVALNVVTGPYTTGAAFWSDGVLSPLDPLPDNLYSRAYGLNNRGQVVGVSSGGAVARGVIWEKGTITPIGSLGDDTIATLINDAGQVAGWGSTDLHEFHAFLWDRGTMIDLSTPLPQASVLCHCVGEASGLNERGQVVMNEYNLITGERQAILWDSGTRTVIDAGNSLGTFFADRINDFGEVSGGRLVYSPPGYPDYSPFFWKDGVMAEWNMAAVTSTATAMNRSGQVVGETTISTNDVRGFVWDAGLMVELIAPPYASAADINDRGVIAGSAFVPPHGVHAVIWTPTNP